MTIAIVGVGEVEPAWKHDRPVLGLVVDAVRRALEDAGLAGSQVDGITTEAETMHGAGPDEVGVALGIRDRRFTAQSSVAGAGVLSAVQLAELAIDAGLADVVVSYYGISLSTQAGGPYNVHAEDPAKAALEMPFGFFGQPVYFGALAQRYAHEFGLTSEQLASVPIAARAFARRTPGALATDPLDLEGYLADRVVADPLRRLDCCLINDAAAAFVMTSAERARTSAGPPCSSPGPASAPNPSPKPATSPRTRSTSRWRRSTPVAEHSRPQASGQMTSTSPRSTTASPCPSSSNSRISASPRRAKGPSSSLAAPSARVVRFPPTPTAACFPSPIRWVPATSSKRSGS